MVNLKELLSSDLAAVKKMTAEYEDASPKILKRFGLV